MKRSGFALVGMVCVLSLLTLRPVQAASNKPSFSAEQLAGKSRAEKAEILLEGATRLAGNGSWERIAVGRAWYLGGNKAKGQALFDQVTSTDKVEPSDWLRIGYVYVEAHELDKAKAAFAKFFTLAEGEDKEAVHYGSLLNAADDPTKGEELILKGLSHQPKEFWNWVNAGASYLGVAPQL